MRHSQTSLGFVNVDFDPFALQFFTTISIRSLLTSISFVLVTTTERAAGGVVRASSCTSAPSCSIWARSRKSAELPLSRERVAEGPCEPSDQDTSPSLSWPVNHLNGMLQVLEESRSSFPSSNPLYIGSFLGRPLCLSFRIAKQYRAENRVTFF